MTTITTKTDGVDILTAADMNAVLGKIQNATDEVNPLTIASSIYVTGFTSTRIQNAFDLASSVNGTKIVFRPGSYTKSTTIIVRKSGLVIEGFGPGSSIRHSSNSDCFSLATGVSRLVFQNMRIRSDRILTGVGIRGVGGNVLLTFRNVTFASFLDSGMRLDHANSVYIDACHFDRCGSTTSTNGALILEATSGETTDILIHKSLFEPSYYADIDLRDTIGTIRVISCWFEGQEIGGIVEPSFAHIKGTGLLVKGFIFAFNRIYDVGGASSYLAKIMDVYRSRVVGNEAQLSVTNGTNVYDFQTFAQSSFFGNTMYTLSGSAVGVRVNTGGTRSAYAFNEISGSSNSVGMRLANNTNSIVIGNSITGGLRGIDLQSVSQSIISGNTLSTVTGFGIIENVNCIGNNITDNRFSFMSGSTKISPSSQSKVKYNFGYTTENGGDASISHGTTIAHGLASTPTKIVLISQSAKPRITSIKSKSASTFTVGLWDTAASALTGAGASRAYWYAEV